MKVVSKLLQELREIWLDIASLWRPKPDPNFLPKNARLAADIRALTDDELARELRLPIRVSIEPGNYLPLIAEALARVLERDAKR